MPSPSSAAAAAAVAARTNQFRNDCLLSYIAAAVTGRYHLPAEVYYLPTYRRWCSWGHPRERKSCDDERTLRFSENKREKKSRETNTSHGQTKREHSSPRATSLRGNVQSLFENWRSTFLSDNSNRGGYEPEGFEQSVFLFSFFSFVSERFAGTMLKYGSRMLCAIQWVATMAFNRSPCVLMKRRRYTTYDRRFDSRRSRSRSDSSL